jgi:acetyl-CoA carboxylase carboxyl transferase subunit alpha
MQNSVYSVISPESCAAIVYRDSAKAPDAAAALKMTAPDMLRLGLVDKVIGEPDGGAQENYDAAALSLGDAVAAGFAELGKLSRQQLVDQRYEKFRRMGSFFAEA